MPKDYVGMRTKDPEDKEDHGIKGQKWGVVRSSKELAKGLIKRKKAGEEITPTKKAEKVLAKEPEATKKPAETSSQPAKIPGIQEPAPERYARLQTEAKDGKASDWNEADLKFFNARTEALSKVAKLNETQPGWLSTTAKTVLKSAAQRQMQAVTNSVADKYISEKISASLKNDDKAKLKESPTPLDYIAKHRAKK
jgi:hypothetical protein